MLLNWRCLSQKPSSPAYTGMGLTLPQHRERDEMVPSMTGEEGPLRRSPLSPDFSRFLSTPSISKPLVTHQPWGRTRPACTRTCGTNRGHNHHPKTTGLWPESPIQSSLMFTSKSIAWSCRTQLRPWLDLQEPGPRNSHRSLAAAPALLWCP